MHFGPVRVFMRQAGGRAGWGRRCQGARLAQPSLLWETCGAGHGTLLLPTRPRFSPPHPPIPSRHSFFFNSFLIFAEVTVQAWSKKKRGGW